MSANPDPQPSVLDITKPDSALGSQLRHWCTTAAGGLATWGGISSKWVPVLAAVILWAIGYFGGIVQAWAAKRHIDVARALPEGSTRALVDELVKAGGVGPIPEKLSP